MSYRTPCLWAIVGICLMSGCASNNFLTTQSNPSFDQQLSVARLMEHNGNAAEAIKVYEKIVQIDGEQSEAFHRLGVIAAENKETDKAMRHFDSALAVGGPNADVLNDIGYLYFLNGDLPNAEQHLRQAISVNPHHRGARNNLGLALGRQQKWEECFQEFQQAAGSDSLAYANMAFVQAQCGDVDQARKNYHRALDLDANLQSAAMALMQLPVDAQDIDPNNEQQYVSAPADNPAQKLAKREPVQVAQQESVQQASVQQAPVQQASVQQASVQQPSVQQYPNAQAGGSQAMVASESRERTAPRSQQPSPYLISDTNPIQQSGGREVQAAHVEDSNRNHHPTAQTIPTRSTVPAIQTPKPYSGSVQPSSRSLQRAPQSIHDGWSSL